MSAGLYGYRVDIGTVAGGSTLPRFRWNDATAHIHRGANGTGLNNWKRTDDDDERILTEAAFLSSEHNSIVDVCRTP